MATKHYARLIPPEDDGCEPAGGDCHHGCSEAIEHAVRYAKPEIFLFHARRHRAKSRGLGSKYADGVFL